MDDLKRRDFVCVVGAAGMLSAARGLDAFAGEGQQRPAALSQRDVQAMSGKSRIMPCSYDVKARPRHCSDGAH
jgi:hypothetical protein